MKKIIAIITMLMMIQLVSALDVKIYDENDFEIDVFEAGQKAVIKVNSAVMPDVTINDEKIEMQEEGEQMYYYDYTTNKRGEHEIKAEAGNETASVKLFVTTELKLEQWEANDVIENNKIYKGQEANITFIKEGKIDSSWFDDLIDFFKRSWVIVYG